jgi:tetratricopeptide (TPR) repeat protein
LHGAGKTGGAATLCEEVLQENPAHFDALHLRAVIFHQAGDLGNAKALFDRALAVRSDSALLHSNHGSLLRSLKRPEEAVASYDKAIALDPARAQTHFRRGNALYELKRLEEAVLSYDKAIALEPDTPEPHNNRGNVLADLRRPAEAVASYDRAIALKSDYQDALYNRGIALFDLRRFDEAVASYDRAIALKPDHAESWSNRGNALKDLGRFDEAVASCKKAIALRPGYANAELNMSIALLSRGDLASGWASYEARKRRPGPAGNRTFGRTTWLGGEPLAGRTILVHWEQGLGDTIHFCRYLSLLNEAGVRVLFAPQKSLRGLMKGFDAEFELVDENDATLTFDCQVPLLSLPLAFRTELRTIPSRVPYLKAEPERVERWRRRLGEGGFRIGVCGQGGHSSAARSFPIGLLDSIARIEGVRLISLHKGDGKGDGEGLLAGLAPSMTVETLGESFDAGPDAFVDTAAVIKTLDLVITADTAIGHLAGALGCPVWLALQRVPDWRWMMDRTDSPWYPTMRLFRQERQDDWSPVFAGMREALVELIGHTVRPGAATTDTAAPRDSVAEEAASLLRRGLNRQAITLLTAQKELSIGAMNCLCDAYFQARDWAKAHEIVTLLLATGHTTPYNQRLQFKTLSNWRRHGEALVLARAFLRDHEDDIEALETATVCCHHLKDTQAAVAYGQKALRAKDLLAGPSPAAAHKIRPNAQGRRLISFSVWGDNRAYLLGAAINVRLAARHFPGWIVRIYCPSSLDPTYVALYRGLGAELVFADKDFPDVPSYFWRFLVADDGDTQLFLSRDADCRLSALEARLVGEWLQSGKHFHVMRDHVLHDTLMLAGMWGGVGSRQLQIRDRIGQYFRGLSSGTPTNKYGHDQRFLAGMVWPLVRPSVFVHDRFYATPGVESHRHSFDFDFGAGHVDIGKVVEEAAHLGLVRTAG